jgi:hypothetical protein
MEQLNQKVISSQDETLFSAQVSGGYGYDETAKKWRRLVCDSEGKQKIEATLELDSSTLAKDATLTNGSQEAKCMGNDSGSQQQILVSATGVVQTLDSEVFGKTSQIANQTTLSNVNEATLIANQTNGTQLSRCMGIDTATSLQHQLKVESDGALHVITENADSVLIKGIETGTSTQRDCKQNANGDLRVQLIANDGNDGAGTMRIVKCDANGVLDTAGGGGGGSTQYAVATTGMGSGTGTLMIGSAGGSAKEVNVSTAGSIHTKATELQNEGTTGNANPAVGTSMGPGTYSLVVDISNMREGSILYNDASTASFDSLDIEVSGDGATYYRLDGIYPFISGSVRTAFRSVSLHGLTHLRLKNVSSSDTYTSVSGTIVGCP